MRRKSSASLFLGSLDPKLKANLLNLNIKREELKKFEEIEKKEEVSTLIDLRDLKSHNDQEVLSCLNALCQNGQYFIYNGPILININPGPKSVHEYLNLEKWINENKGISDLNWKPHLYSFINYIYQIICSENKDQVVNMLGQIGSGKTFNLIHSLEYICYLAVPVYQQIEIFETIHKSIQLIHLMASVYRNNNMESTSSGLLLKIGFNNENKISSFDFEASLLDFTLPFSVNGRSYSILHALIVGANNDMKKMLEISDSNKLQFFKKYQMNFDESMKQRFKYNDLEIWTKFHSLLKFFGFTKNEVFDILNLFSFILLCNEANIGKKIKQSEEYSLLQGGYTRKIAKVLNIREEELLAKLGTFKEINELKNFLTSLIKITFWAVFEFIKNKIKDHLRLYFDKFNKVNEKYLYFIDFSGEVNDPTIGGLCSNLANEFLSSFASSNYHNIVNKLEEEKLNLKHFQHLHSFKSIESILGRNGLLNAIFNNNQNDGFVKFTKSVQKIKNRNLCIKFDQKNNKTLNFKFSHSSINFDFDMLCNEAKTLMINKKHFAIFDLSKNSIIKSQMKFISSLVEKKNFIQHIVQSIKKLLKPVESLYPFVVYCLHSNNSLKTYTTDKNKHYEDWIIPRNQTLELCRNSLILHILYWEWLGYHEWIDISLFIEIYKNDFIQIKEKIFKTSKNKKMIKSINLNDLNPYEIVTYILSVLGFNEKNYILGLKHVILKKGLQTKINNIIADLNKKPESSIKTIKFNDFSNVTNKDVKGNRISLQNKSQAQNRTKSGIRRSADYRMSNRSSYNENEKTQTESQQPKFLRKRSLKIQCHINLIEQPNITVDNIIDNNKLEDFQEKTVLSNTNIIFKYLHINQYSSANNSCDNSYDDIHDEKSSNENQINFDKFIKDNNIIVANNVKQFDLFRTILDKKNYKIFDYTDYIDEIIKIQTAFRAFRSRTKYKIFRYAIRRLIKIQSVVKGHLSRRTFQEFKYINDCIILIQRSFKTYFNKKVFRTIFIQKCFRAYYARKYMRRIINKIRQSVLKPNNDSMSLSEFDFENDEDRLNFQRISGSLQKMKNEHQLFKKNASNLSNIEFKNLDPTLEKDKILDHLMNLDMSNIKNSDGINTSMIKSQKNIQKQMKTNVQGRIEDRLLKYGQELKQKKEDLYIEKQRVEEEKYRFVKPTIRKNSSLSIIGNKNSVYDQAFLDRQKEFNLKKQMKLEKLREKYPDKDHENFSFKPEVSSTSKNLKRGINDLYKWKAKKDKDLDRKIKQKEIEEQKDIEEKTKIIKCSKNSAKILINKYQKYFEQMNDEEEIFDFWPNI